jgi:hypothetical protein
MDAASAALAMILYRDSSARALAFIIEDLASVPRSVKFLLEQFESLEPALIRRGLSHRDADIRAVALRTLRSLEVEAGGDAALLRGDPSAAVRKEAVLYALARGESLDREDIRKIIVRSGDRSGLYLTTSEGTSEFQEVERALLRELGVDALREHALQFYAPSDYAYELLAARDWKAMAGQVRADVADDFAGYFDRVVVAYRQKFGEGPALSLINSFTSDLKNYRTGFMRRAALNAIVAKGERRDLSLVRSMLQGETAISERDLKYLARFGEWSDIRIIAEASSKVSTTLALWGDERRYKAAARTICILAKGRASELVKLDMSRPLMASVVSGLAKVEFLGLPNASIISLMNDQNADLRKAVAQKCIATMSKRRIAEILSAYLAQSYMFYNAIHWLDLGVSFSKAEIETILKAEASVSSQI